MSLLADNCLTTNSALLCNDLQQWGLYRLPRLHQGWLSAMTSGMSVSQLLTADSQPLKTQTDWLRLVGWLVGWLVTQSFLTSVSSKKNDQDFCSFLDLYVFQNGAFSLTREGSIFLSRRYICCNVVSAQVYLCCHGIQVTMYSVHPLSLHYLK
jgi:hypothetical protein